MGDILVRYWPNYGAMDLEDKIVKEFAEWAKSTQAGYGEDEADIWFEDIPAYDALEWKVREIVRTLLTTKDAERDKAVEAARREAALAVFETAAAKLLLRSEPGTVGYSVALEFIEELRASLSTDQVTEK